VIYTGDCLEVLAGMPENSIDTCITDPPYELGFMGKKWDSSGIAFQPETWQAVYRVLKPGALLLAFGGTRTYHRMVCAIEDAGFEIRDMVEWVYGSGFPKSYDIGKGIDKQAGVEREVIGRSPHYCEGRGQYTKGDWGMNSKGGDKDTDWLTAPSTPEAQLWDGWGTALKPSHEPIVLAMKPIDGTFVNNALTWGVAGLWIDGGRVEYASDDDKSSAKPGSLTYNADKRQNIGLAGAIQGILKNNSGQWNQPAGRFPANFIHDGSDEVKELFPETKSGSINGTYNNTIMAQSNGDRNGKPIHLEFNGDSGSAARFFYCAKASRSERNAGLELNKQNHHPTVKPISLMRYLVRLTKTPTGGVVLDPFMGSGTTGIACELEGREFIGIEREPEYVEIAEKRIAHYRLPIMDEAGA